MQYSHEINSRRLTSRGMSQAALNHNPSTFMYLPSSPPPQQLYSNTLQPVGTDMELAMLLSDSEHSAWGGFDPALQGMFPCAESSLPFHHPTFSSASYQDYPSSPTRMYPQEEFLSTPFPSSSRDVLHASTCPQGLSIDGVVPSSTPAHVASFAGCTGHLVPHVGQSPATSPMETRPPTPMDARKLVVPTCNICGFIPKCPRDLNQHKESHLPREARKQFRCDVQGCWKSYLRANDLKRHKEKPHSHH